jgi:NAD+ synthase
LWEDDRTDEEQIGASYEELEWAMETQKAFEDMSKREKEVFEVYTHFNERNSHKMNPIPIFRLGRNVD